MGLVVVEPRLLPFCFIVTGLTFLAVAAPVGVLQSVARDTGPSQVLIYLAAVTGVAGDGLMRGFERELGFAVVKTLRLPPFGWGVAAVTFLAEPALVRIVLLVAVEALE